MLRTSENKVYRQGISDPNELADGFPVRPEDLFAYSGIIIGSVDADYFTPLQQELLREYVDRRGGGILFLGGRSSLSDGGWAASSLNELLPTFLPAGRNNFHRNPATVELTHGRRGLAHHAPARRSGKKRRRAGRKLTYLADYEDAGAPKPGATVLASLNAGRRKMPLLITQSYGHGRTAVMATGGTWRWQMSEALGDPSHDLFWHQLLRWLVADTPGPVVASMPARILMDEGHVQITAQVHDRQFQPAAGCARDGARRRPAGRECVPRPGSFARYSRNVSSRTGQRRSRAPILPRSPLNPRTASRRSWAATWSRSSAKTAWPRNFTPRQNRALLEQLASQTGGRYWKPGDLKDPAPRYLLLRSRHLRAQHQRALEHARRLRAARGPARGGMAAAPQVGCRMKHRAKTHSQNRVAAMREVL